MYGKRLNADAADYMEHVYPLARACFQQAN